ncbi:hypothetical protein [Pseudomonas tolaasii]|uniref:hypothetical protein n=1 Tax=Pseudomonas tolaasii TaxID=29442 RepID=UPI0015A442F7|nr:hypothetical protein [Pseudomonas tolaasii]NWC43743.1 hypothetical protein [Pseudomonas tolaasii]
MPISDHDQHYTCPTCSWTHTVPDSLDNKCLDTHTWLCNTCPHPVHIMIRDDHGRRCLVQRVRAQLLESGDEILYDAGNGMTPAHVRTSAKATAKGHAGQWSLSLSGPHTLMVPPFRYFNRILPA